MKTLFHNGKIAGPGQATAVLIEGRHVSAVGGEELLEQPHDQRIDLKGRRVIPGLNDSHLHVIRAGLYYNLELRWDGLPSLAEGLRRLRRQAEITPPPHWIRVVGGGTSGSLPNDACRP